MAGAMACRSDPSVIYFFAGGKLCETGVLSPIVFVSRDERLCCLSLCIGLSGGGGGVFWVVCFRRRS